METALFFKQAEKNYPKAKELFEQIDLWNEIDGLYRVYHHSFKMYYELQEAITDYLNVLFELTGISIERLEDGSVTEKLERSEKHYDGIEAKLKKLELDEFFSRTILEALNITFEDNDKDLWQEHQKVLTSAVYHSKVGITAVMKVAEKYYSEKKLPGEGGLLDEYECICEHILGFSDYRWISPDDLRKKITEIE